MYNDRLQKLQALMIQKRLLALFVTSPQNVTYLSGFRGLCSTDVLVPCLTDLEVVLFITPRATYYLTDKRHGKNNGNTHERKMIRSPACQRLSFQEPQNIMIQRYVPRTLHRMARHMAGRDQNALRYVVVEKNVFDTVQSLCKKLGIQKLGIEYEALRVSDFQLLQQKLKDITFCEASSLVHELRCTKNKEEIAALTKACRVTDAAFTALLRAIRIGMTEGAIAYFLVDFFHRNADGPAFAPIVASGVGAAIPHYRTSKTKKIRNGEMLLLDFGTLYHGYHADISRTLFLGEATPRFKKIYTIVLEAQRKTIDALHAGMSGKAADAIARQHLTTAGFKKEFAHGTGHGVGLQIHEAPQLSPLSNDTLHEHHVFTVEPGLYFPKWGGVRIEDTILLTKQGPRMLTRSSKKLIEI